MTYLLIVSYFILAHWFKCPFFQVYHDLICILCIGVIFFRLFSQWCYSLKMVATICIVSNTILCFQIQLLMWVIYKCGMAMKLGGLHLPLLLQKGIGPNWPCLLWNIAAYYFLLVIYSLLFQKIWQIISKKLTIFWNNKTLND